MKIIPAIDLKDGQVVRLLQGKFKEITIYSHDPVAIAKKWEALGASLLHIVDLDGALTGELKNLKVIEKIINAVNIPIQTGGGVRKQEDIDNFFNLGVKSVVIATKVLEDSEFLKQALTIWGERIIVSIDSAHDKVFDKGWTAIFSISPKDLAKQMEAMGVKKIIYTDISRDGTLRGPDINGIKSIIDAVGIPVVVAGGISCLEDIKKIKELEKNGLAGIIIGMALYEGRIDLAEAIKLCSPSA